MELRTEIQYEGVGFSELSEAILALHPSKLPMIVTEDHGVSARLGTTSHVEGQFHHEAMVGEEMTADFLAKELVQLRMVARAQVEKLGVNENRRVYLDTTKNGRAAVQREFGGLNLEWIPIQGNKDFLEFVTKHVKYGSDEL